MLNIYVDLHDSNGIKFITKSVFFLTKVTGVTTRRNLGTFFAAKGKNDTVYHLFKMNHKVNIQIMIIKSSQSYTDLIQLKHKNINPYYKNNSYHVFIYILLFQMPKELFYT
jgi:hypothetical protein